VPIPGPRPGPRPQPAAAAAAKANLPGLKEVEDLLNKVFPYADTNKDGFVDRKELGAFFFKTSRRKELTKRKAQNMADEFFTMASLQNVKMTDKGISKKDWVNYQTEQFRRVALVTPPEETRKELAKAVQTYKRMLKDLTEGKERKEEPKKDKGDAGKQVKGDAKSKTSGKDAASAGSKPAKDDVKKGEKKKVKRKMWLPLESDPNLVNNYMRKLGVDTNKFEFHDIFGLTPDGTMHIPTPILAVMLLFPITEASEKARVEEEKKIAESKAKAPEGVYHVTQTVGNACGTIAVLHAVLNNMDRLKPKEGKFFSKFLEETKTMTSKERAKALGESKDLEVEHEVVAKAGKTKANAKEFANLHFIAFIKKNDVLYEMDGRKSMPISHGKTSGASFLEDAFKQVKKYMAYAPKDRRFNVIVLAPKANNQPAAWGGGAGGGGGAPSGGAPDEAAQKERIASLAAMGIPEEAARVALTQTNWSANRAVEFYFANMMG